MMNISRCKIRFYFLLLLVLFLSLNINAQNKESFSVHFKWNGIEKHHLYGDTLSYLSFDGASLEGDTDNLRAVFSTMIPVWDDDIEADFEVLITASEAVPQHELSYIPNDISSKPHYEFSVISSSDNSNVYFTLVPFFNDNDTIKRILSCDVSYSLKQQKRQYAKTYVENSVLSSGKWYMMSLSSTSMYKITYSELSSMGIDVASINPKHIRIFHNGGGVLPMVNKEERYEDLVEIPIYVHGENDASFDENDYIILYARGPVTWKYKNGVYERVLNPYSDFSYIFLTTDLGEGKRIQNAINETAAHDVLVNSFLDYQLKEENIYNLNNMGASWYFDKYDATTSMSYTFNFPNIIKDKKCSMKSEVVSRNTASSASFDFNLNGERLSFINFSKLTSSSSYAKEGSTGNVKFNSPSDEINIKVNYVKNASSSSGWIDYIAINAWRELKMAGNTMIFRNPECDDADKKYRYEIKNAGNTLQVWDVTNPLEPKRMNLQMQSGNASFVVSGNEKNEFVAFDGSGFGSLTFVTSVQNQNLHSKYDFDYLIVTYPEFESQAQRLKEIHSTIDDLEIEIVTPQQIYNEFSCGAVDIAAIRDYIKMIYDKSGKRLKYVLLFGDSSYDFRNYSGNVCLIPSYESVHSVSSACDVSDDFFACMDPDEGDMHARCAIDIAIGRMPVNTLEEATIVVDKIERYISKEEDAMGHWRKLVTFVADDDVTSYMQHAEQLQNIVKEDMGNDVNFDKIYLDAYPQIATSSGQRSPECNAAITNRVELGSLIVNYIGHAGEIGWAEERILTNDDIFALQNSPKLNLMLAASCEFSRFDDHTRTSAGEYVFLNKNGGAVAMYTAARVTYNPNNQNMMKRFYERLFDVEGGEFITMGEAYVYAKGVADDNCHDYVFFGDPALRLNFPKNKIQLTSINNHNTLISDTLRALQSINIKGVVKDMFDNTLNDFNGIVHVNVYDKENSYTTYGNEDNPYNFKLRDNVIYTGKMPVVNGEFDIDFTLPKDINYSYGGGLMSFYAYSSDADAQGSYSNFIVGGLNQDAEPDDKGPEIKIYIDDEKFVDGSMTNENPVLIAYIKDENGINTSAAGIGHDITATLTGATNKTYSLNNFYEAPLSVDEYGTLSYKLYNLNEGEHLLTFRAWDIYNNSNSATISFNVVKGKIINIENVVNYPNPMYDNTNFTFEHNQKDNEIMVQIKIYDVMGQLVRIIEEHSFGTTARINPIRWDGTSNNGKKLPAGMYIYSVTVTNAQNEKTSGYSKLIIK